MLEGVRLGRLVILQSQLLRLDQFLLLLILSLLLCWHEKNNAVCSKMEETSVHRTRLMDFVFLKINS